MPLRDHFRPPLDDLRYWESLHGGWPMMIVANLRTRLPRRYFAGLGVHSGASAEIDVATFESESEGEVLIGNGSENGGGVATAVWAPPRPTLAVAADLPAQDEYEVRVYDRETPLSSGGRRRDRQPGQQGPAGTSAGVRVQVRRAAAGARLRRHRGRGDDALAEPVRRICST